MRIWDLVTLSLTGATFLTVFGYLICCRFPNAIKDIRKRIGIYNFLTHVVPHTLDVFHQPESPADNRRIVDNDYRSQTLEV